MTKGMAKMFKTNYLELSMEYCVKLEPMIDHQISLDE